MQITIHEIRHFTLMTELLTFKIYIAFLCKPIWGNASVSYHGITVPLVLTSFGERRPQKIFRETVFPHVSRSPSTTPLATPAIFQSITYNIFAMPT